MNYEMDMQIDETSLDVEWLEQGNLAIKYGAYWSKCRTELSKAEENVKLVRSQLIIAIIKNPDKYLGEGVKATDVKVEAAYRKHPKYIAAKERLIEAMENEQMALIVKNEISFTRKSALENLVSLHGQQYFAGPSTPRNLFEERKKHAQKRAKISKAINEKIQNV